MDAFTQLLLDGAASPFVLVAVFLTVVVDGFFPPVPSETVVVALASIGFATGAPSPWLVLLAAAVGSFVGDNVAFTIGRRFGVDRFRITRGPRAARLLARVRSTLETRSASTILTARFIPVGRVAVNVLAGASNLPRRRFVVLSAISGVAWAGYSILIGVLAGAWLRDQPLLGAAVAAVAAFGIGMLVDLVVRRRRPARTPATGQAAPLTTSRILTPGDAG